MAKNLVIKKRSFIPTPKNFCNPYVVNLIKYVVTEILYDPPPSVPDLAHLWAWRTGIWIDDTYLTYNDQLVSFAPLWLSVDLAFVDSRVLDCGPVNVELPVWRDHSELGPVCRSPCSVRMNGFESCVVGVHRRPHRQNMQVFLANPRYLRTIKQLIRESWTHCWAWSTNDVIICMESNPYQSLLLSCPFFLKYGGRYPASNLAALGASSYKNHTDNSFSYIHTTWQMMTSNMHGVLVYVIHPCPCPLAASFSFFILFLRARNSVIRSTPPPSFCFNHHGHVIRDKGIVYACMLKFISPHHDSYIIRVCLLMTSSFWVQRDLQPKWRLLMILGSRAIGVKWLR